MIDAALLKDLAGCESAETLLAAILRHDPQVRMPVDVEGLAHRVGIVELGSLNAEGAACALTVAPGKNTGSNRGAILCAPGLPAQRRRFAIAHQLGHFLLRTHPWACQCTNRDMAESRRDTPHRKQEMQANRFAAGLLMPKPWFADLVAGLGKPGVAHIPTIATAFAVSLETAAARYADLTQDMCALLFIKDGTLRYARASRSFPDLSLLSGAPVPPTVLAARPEDRIAWLPADPQDWIAIPRNARQPKLTMQILSKANGFQLVMLFISAAAEKRAEEEAEKDATEIPKFGRQRSR